MIDSLESLRQQLAQTSAAQDANADIQVLVQGEVLHVLITADGLAPADSPTPWVDWLQEEWQQILPSLEPDLKAVATAKIFGQVHKHQADQDQTDQNPVIVWQQELTLAKAQKPKRPIDRDALFQTITPAKTTNLFSGLDDLLSPAEPTPTPPAPKSAPSEDSTQLFFQGLAQGVAKESAPKDSQRPLPQESRPNPDPPAQAVPRQPTTPASETPAKLGRQELVAFFVLGLILFGNAISQKISEIAAISNFLNDVGAERMLLVWIVDGFLNILITGFQSLIIDRFNRITLIQVISLGLALSFVVIRVLFFFNAPSWLSYASLFLISQQQLVFFPLVFWILANDIFDLSQSKRLFPRLAVWGLVGNVVGIGLAAFIPPLLERLGIDLQVILSINIIIYIIIAVILIVGLDRGQVTTYPQAKEKISDVLSEGWAFVREVPAFRYLTLSIFLVIICETAIEFRFFEVLEVTFSSAADNQFFYSLYYFIRLGLSIFIQLLMTTNILNTIGLKNAFFILPISSLVAFLCIILQPSLWGVMFGTLMEKIPQYTVDESARKAFQGLVPEMKRGRVSSFMDSYLLSLGAIFGSFLVGISLVFSRQWSFLDGFDLPAIIGFSAAVLSLIYIFQMRKVYDKSMLNWRLKRRQRVKSVLDDLNY